MEDVKEHKQNDTQIRNITCFNPCFNGRCKRTIRRLKRIARL